MGESLLNDGARESDAGSLRQRLRLLRDSLPARIAAAGRRPLIVGFATGALVLVIAAVITWTFWADRLVPMPAPDQQRLAIVNSTAPPPLLAPDLMPVTEDDARAINAKMPFATLHPVAAKPLRFTGSNEDLARAVDCLAAAAWYEAGGDATGQRAVIQTVINRSRHPAFPASICGVVFQGSERRTGCQFTFTCDGAMGRTPSPTAWQAARQRATAALTGEVYAPIGYATHYHADYVVPYWASSLDKIAMVGPHIFYRWPGHWGTPASFRGGVAGQEPVEPLLARLSPSHAVVPESADASSEAELATAPTAAPPLSPGLMPKVSETALRGSAVRDANADGSAVFLKLDPAAFAGSYAMTSLALCKGKRTCRVLGWRDDGSVSRALPLGDASARQLSFLYVKDMKRGIDRAWWNCGQISRGDSGQCLPADPAAVRKLIDPE